MGVRGLTSYVARNADHYLKPYELHDTNLVIDGDNLACNLYKDLSGIYSAFGGDYDDYYRGVLRFFAVLAECHVTPFVLMDGGYQSRKMYTVTQRMRNKISIIKRINPAGSVTIFPLMLKEVFIDALHDLKIPVMRCVFEADDELAALSRALNCPVLSYDSDFYIHDVSYIPLVTLTLKAHTKLISAGSTAETIASDQTEMVTKSNNSGNVKQRSLRKCEVRKYEKRTRSHKIIAPITLNNCEKKKSKSKKRESYKYLDCCIYRNNNFMSKGALSAEKLPLLAAMLGNDYISRSSFKNFYTYGMGKLGRCSKTKHQQKRILKIIKWLRYETTETAMEKILNRIPKKERPVLRRKVIAAMENYNIEKCYSYDYFRQNYPETILAVEKQIKENKEKLEELKVDDNSDEEEEIIESSDGEGEIFEFSDDDEEIDISDKEEISTNSDNEKEISVHLEDLLTDIYSEKKHADISDNIKRINNFQNEEESDQKKVSILNENVQKTEEDNDSIKSELESDMESNKSLPFDEDDSSDNCGEPFPEWFLQKLHAAQLPRFYVDLVHLRKYINNPIIEHFPYPDCNQIAIPILCHVFTLLQKCKGAQFRRHSKSITVEEKPYFTYLTRQIRFTNVHYVRYEMNETEADYLYDPEQPDFELLKVLFRIRMPELDCDQLFDKALPLLPKDLQLYFLAMVFWLHKSKHCKLEHVHSLIICLIVLRTIDSKITPERDLAAFAKRYGKIISREKIMRAAAQAKHNANKNLSTENRLNDENSKEKLTSDRDLTIAERMHSVPKSDCYLVQNELLKHFHMPEIFKKKYDLYSSIILHAFSEFQSVLYQLYALNSLLNCPLEFPRMAQLYCGVFLYNLYNLMKDRLDVHYYVKNFIFRDSQMMYDFYEFLWNWCEPFIPSWKQDKQNIDIISKSNNCAVKPDSNNKNVSVKRKLLRKKLLKTKKEILRKQQQVLKEHDESEQNNCDGEQVPENEQDTAFFDLNNKFSTLLKI